MRNVRLYSGGSGVFVRGSERPGCIPCGLADYAVGHGNLPLQLFFLTTHGSVLFNKSFSQFFSKNCGGLEVEPPRVV